MVASGAGLQNGKFVGAFDDGTAHIKSLMPEVEEEDDSEAVDDLDDAGTSSATPKKKSSNNSRSPVALSGSGQQAKQQAPDIEVFINSLKRKWASQVENLKIEWEKMHNDAEAIRREVESRKTESFLEGSWDTLEKRHQLALLVYGDSPGPLQKYLEDRRCEGGKRKQTF